MGEPEMWRAEPSFNRTVKVQAGDDRITSDAGLLLLREADHRLGITEALADRIEDPRDPDRVRYQIVELLRERIYALAQGYTAQDDLDRLAHDPALKLAAWNRAGEQPLEERLASQPTQSRLIQLLASTPANRAALRDALVDSCERHLRASGADHAARRVTVDIDGLPVDVHGQQPGAAYNGYVQKVIYHTLVASYSVAGQYDGFQHGKRLGSGFVHAILRAGEVHSAQGIRRFTQEVLRRARRLGDVIDLRLDAGFTAGSTLDYLSEQNVRFLGRLASNAVLERLAGPHLRRPVGRPPREGYEEVIELGMYQAESWQHPQRVLLVKVDRPDPKTGQLNLLPRYFFLVTNWSPEELDGPAALAHYRQRGTFEDRLGEWNQAIGPRLSHDSFAANEALLQLSLLAFNLASMLRIEYESAAGSCCDLTRFQRDVLKAGARVVKHSARLVVHVAQAVQPFWERLFACLSRWRLPARFAAPRGPRVRAWVPPPPHAWQREVRRQ